jgi:photosystem II stability/assembly factor-like uncharacterized protein
MTTACLAPNGVSVYRGNGPCQRVLVGTIGGIAVLERDGGAWRRAGAMLEGMHISSMLIEPKRGGLFAGVHRGGVHFSADGGTTWEPRTQGITVDHVYTLGAVEENGEPVLYAGTEPVGLFRSRDYGKSWEELPAITQVPGRETWCFPMPPRIPHLKTLAFDPRDPRSVLAGVEQGGLFDTRDGGGAWRELDGYYRTDDEIYKDVHQVVRRPNHPNEIYMASGNGLYASADDGKNWERLTDLQFRIGYPDKLIFSPADDRTMFMAGAIGNPGTWIKSKSASPSIMVSRDLGRSWTAKTKGLPAEMKPSVEGLAMYVGPGGFTLFAGTTDGEVYASDDGAENWSKICDGLGAVSKSAHFRLLLPGGPGGPGGPPGGPPGARPQA